MSSDVPERPRKTLTLSSRPTSKKPEPQDRERDPTLRKRSGARAKAVAMAERAKALDASADTGPTPKRGAPGNRTGVGRPGADRSGGGRSGGDRSGGDRSGGARFDGARPGAARSESGRADGPRTRSPRPSADVSPDAGRAHASGRERTSGRLGTTDRKPPRADQPARAPRFEPSADVATRHAADAAERFKIYAPCPQGLEEALAAEMFALGFEDATPGRAGCGFTADWRGVQRANLYSRLATRILVQVAFAPISTEDDILELARATPWERWFGAEQTLRVDTSAIRSPVQSLQYCNLRAKDGICDRLRELEGERPSIDTVRPDARVHLFLFENTATLYLDTSGESLFKRGWRLDKGEAPLRENLAAGMLALAGWDPEQPLLDPFCGSGTLLIEAAWIALGIPPGIARPLGFERLRGHDASAWQQIKDEAYSHIAPGLDAPIVGYDIDPQAIEFARRNAERAWLADDAIQFEVRDARAAPRIADHGWIVTNPPYGDRMEESDPVMWQEWSSTLKQNFGGWQLNVITSDMTFPQKLRLKPQRRTPLYNGALDCRLFGFELVEAGYRDA